jgi:DinB family protein
MNMTRRDLETLLLTLESTSALLLHAAASFSPRQARVRPCRGGFSFVENVWHLADLEREGYLARIARLLAEDHPELPDFDGDRVAEERRYASLSLREGLSTFRAARAETLARLRRVAAHDWKRAGRQEGVGAVMLCDLPAMIAAHDASHRAEIEAWLAERR